MMQNVEIKAKIRDIDYTISKAKELSNNDGKIITQHDIFYNATKARLKLRKFEDGTAQLISYVRPNIIGPKVSAYDKVSIYENIVDLVDTILSNALGTVGVIKKTRHVFIVGRTRIHIDNVENLGNFIELEVMMQSGNADTDCDRETAEKTANDLLQVLSVKEEDLIAEAYIDLLNRKNTM
ncbi:uncharacterized protein LOC114937235 [Nylanderia fulva]|uniref:uncharacterized protein LOC114937235 n=1 Tax=Nylanderia fulva TaxID=613905 RepID=UPI0010FAD0D7|nr:uncharacterized protein LOC114937235 [Nylanderia fulva]XP_029166489.1 uncharacterized protein LOC114937235 [Nylanderia fulva]